MLLPAVSSAAPRTHHAHHHQAADLGQGRLIGPPTLPASSAEALEPFFLQQLASSTTLLSRPEIPQLVDKALLVRAYDAGLVDATGGWVVAGVGGERSVGKGMRGAPCMSLVWVGGVEGRGVWPEYRVVPLYLSGCSVPR
jgi:hypothetical protein